MIKPVLHHIGGRQVASISGRRHPDYDPWSREVLAEVASGARRLVKCCLVGPERDHDRPGTVCGGEPEQAAKATAVAQPGKDLLHELEPAVVAFGGRLERVHPREHVPPSLPRQEVARIVSTG